MMTEKEAALMLTFALGDYRKELDNLKDNPTEESMVMDTIEALKIAIHKMDDEII